jgi:hypothetical protein
MAAFKFGEHVFLRHQADRGHPDINHDQVFIVDMLRKPLRSNQKRRVHRYFSPVVKTVFHYTPAALAM